MFIKGIERPFDKGVHLHFTPFPLISKVQEVRDADLEIKFTIRFVSHSVTFNL